MVSHRGRNTCRKTDYGDLVLAYVYVLQLIAS